MALPPPETKKLNQLSDMELVERYLSKQDSLAFNLLYSRYAPKVYAKCISMLKDETAAQDALQDIFIKIFMSLSGFGERARLSTWIFSITYNYCIDLIRKGKRVKEIFTGDESEALRNVPNEDVPDEFLTALHVDRLRAMLDMIPPGDKAILLMKYQDDMSIKEIADAINKQESAVKMQLMRAKQRAQVVLKKLYPEDY